MFIVRLSCMVVALSVILNFLAVKVYVTVVHRRLHLLTYYFLFFNILLTYYSDVTSRT